MITVELEQEELHVLITLMRLSLWAMQRWTPSAAEMKAVLARIEYLEGLK